jgi:uncharacterized damage-inducible protein DinB
MSSSEQQKFITEWEGEAAKTLELLRALPADKYDFRPDTGGRSLGEMAWHLAEIDAYIALGAANGKIDFSEKIPGLERPKTVEALAPGYERIHREAAARVRKMTGEEFDRMMPFLDSRTMRTGDILWRVLLHHMIHHRGQLGLMNRMAGGVTPGLFGPNREEMAEMQAKSRA